MGCGDLHRNGHRFARSRSRVGIHPSPACLQDQPDSRSSSQLTRSQTGASGLNVEAWSTNVAGDFDCFFNTRIAMILPLTATSN